MDAELELYELLKKSEALPDNEASITDKNNVYPDPPGYESREDKANSPEYAAHAVAESNEDRGSLLERVFKGVAQYSSADKSFIASHFENKGEAHSPLLSRKTASQHAPAAPTLVERVHAITGRR